MKPPFGDVGQRAMLRTSYRLRVDVAARRSACRLYAESTRSFEHNATVILFVHHVVFSARPSAGMGCMVDFAYIRELAWTARLQAAIEGFTCIYWRRRLRT